MAFQGRFLLEFAHFCVLEEQQLLAEGIEADSGLEVCRISQNVQDFSLAEPVMLYPHAGTERVYRVRHKVCRSRRRGSRP